MKRYLVTLTIETEIEDEDEAERVLRAALDNLAMAPYLIDYSDLVIAEPEGPEHDFSMVGASGDTVFKLVPLTDAAREWVEENVSREGFQPDWPTIVVEHRYIDNLLGGIDEAGFTVDAVERALARG